MAQDNDGWPAQSPWAEHSPTRIRRSGVRRGLAESATEITAATRARTTGRPAHLKSRTAARCGKGRCSDRRQTAGLGRAPIVLPSRLVTTAPKLLNIQLPDADGFLVADRLAQRPNPPDVVLISSREASDYGSRLRTTTAVGFIHKPVAGSPGEPASGSAPGLDADAIGSSEAWLWVVLGWQLERVVIYLAEDRL